ncbi:MAG: hypothetical protein QOC81_4243 [Thermoanaerobaculia bacterium]|jgi:hypothetical protein|nr:hypothetical protein [Thermoanaerobaculia bacterium]
MIAASDTDYVQHGTVRVGADGASEMDHGRALVRIPHSEIVRLELFHGSGAERPLVCIVLGIVLTLIAIAGPVMLAVAVLRHGSVPAKLVSSVAFIIPAVWLLDLALRRRWCVLVHTRRGSRKLLFGKNSDPAELERFLLSAKARFGYS